MGFLAYKRGRGWLVMGFGLGSERGFREVQRVSEGVQRESEREVIDDDLREQGRGEEVGMRSEVQGRLRGRVRWRCAGAGGVKV